MAADLGILLGSFFGVTAIAYLAGTDNAGVAAGVGQVAFAAALVYVMTRRG